MSIFSNETLNERDLVVLNESTAYPRLPTLLLHATDDQVEAARHNIRERKERNEKLPTLKEAANTLAGRREEIVYGSKTSYYGVDATRYVRLCLDVLLDRWRRLECEMD